MESTDTPIDPAWHQFIEILGKKSIHGEEACVFLCHLGNLVCDRFFRLFFVVAILMGKDELLVLRRLNEEDVLIDKVQVVDFKLFLLVCAGNWHSFQGRMGVVHVLQVNFAEVFHF